MNPGTEKGARGDVKSLVRAVYATSGMESHRSQSARYPHAAGGPIRSVFHSEPSERKARCHLRVNLPKRGDNPYVLCAALFSSQTDLSRGGNGV